MTIALDPLPLPEWKPTCDTLHMWMQVVGKVRLALAPLVNHWWETALYVSPRGLTTSGIPYRDQVFDCEFDFIDHQLLIRNSDGHLGRVALAPRSVADFYAETMARLHDCGVDVKIWTTPSEVDNPIPFEEDREHASYDREAVERFWRILIFTDRALNRFRASFIGKSSPVHFFWGSFDMAVTRFSGRRAPADPKADSITREACSHEVSSCGWWPGGGASPSRRSIQTPLRNHQASRRRKSNRRKPPISMSCNFVLPYEAVRQSPDPEDILLRFCQSTYAAAADLGGWDRAGLERVEV